MSCVTVMLCLALVAGGTYALFSDQVTLTTHLKAGTLDITLIRTNLETKALDNTTGFLVGSTDAEPVDFSRPNNRNVFDIEEGHKIVPGCSYDATLEITNNTDVAFSYWVEVINRNTEDIALGDQLMITVTMDDAEFYQKLSEGVFIGSDTKPIGMLMKGQADSFNVKLEFLDLPNNNAAKNQTLNFDIVVHAVQLTEAPRP